MQVRKFCLCGCKLEREVADEATAREVIILWRNEHTREGCGPASYRQYMQAVSRIVARNAHSNQPKELMPLLSPRWRFTLIQGGQK